MSQSRISVIVRVAIAAQCRRFYASTSRGEREVLLRVGAAIATRSGTGRSTRDDVLARTETSSLQPICPLK